MNNDAFAALHTSSGEACRVQDAVALGRRIEWLTATDKILKQDLMRGQRGRVVVAGMKTNELLEAAPMQLHPIGVSGRPFTASGTRLRNERSRQGRKSRGCHAISGTRRSK
jgi:hypothetical protein